MATAIAKALNANTTKDEALSWLMAGEITVDDYKRWDATRDHKKLLVAVKRTDQQYQVYGKPVGVTEAGNGTVLVKGLRRLPIGFYPEEWVRIFSMKDEILATIETHRAGLSFKHGG